MKTTQITENQQINIWKGHISNMSTEEIERRRLKLSAPPKGDNMFQKYSDEEFAKIAKKHINFSFGSEFPNYKDFLTNKTLMLCVSQSGETADTLEAIEIAQDKKVKICIRLN